ncbi:MAG TPA: dethiobiotin synthase [Planctomycetota bacterium]|nr:dethiobiotin synthase [Planctomycetota bacterium]
MIRAVFVTGTDTGVGKTVVSAGLAAAWARRGADVGVFKPFATGAVRRGRRWVSEDAELLLRASGAGDPPELVTPALYRPPLAPSEAARLERRPVDLDAVARAWRLLRRRHERLVVEGVGGILVPVRPRLPVARWAARFKLPVLVVTRPTLGTINHTALTVLAARAYGLHVLGLVLNYHAPFRKGLAERLNPRALEEETGRPVLATIPYLGGDVARALRHSEFDRLARRLEDA